MDLQSLWIIFLFFLFLDLGAVSVRIALVHTRLPQLIDLRESNPGKIDRILKLLDKPNLRVALRVCVVIMHFLLAGAAWLIFQKLVIEPAAWVDLVMLLLIALLILMMEFVLEGWIMRGSERWALQLSWLGEVIEFVLRPFTQVLVALLGSSASGLLARNSVTEDELKTWVETEQVEGGLEKGERKMIYSIFQFGDTLCREIMVPRIDMFGLDVTMPLNEAIHALAESRHSRVPVYEDTIDNILGLIHAKDLLRLGTCPDEDASIRSLLRTIYFVPEAKKVDELLREMQLHRVHMAIVVDEYGGTAGLVTLEDIVEEIVGEIRDEYDQGEEQLYQQINLEEFTFNGRADIQDVNDALGTHLTRDVSDSLGGFIYGEVGRIPVGGEQIEIGDWILTVEQVAGRRIRKVRALKKPAPIPNGG